MKKTLFLLPFLLMLLGGCKKIDQLLSFEIPTSVNIQIPASSPLNLPLVSPVPVTSNSQQSFENNGTRPEMVRDVRLKSLTLTITSPSGANFNFLQSIRIYIGTDQNDKVLLASLDDVPNGVSTIDLVSANAKLDNYIKASSYTLFTEVGLRSTLSQELTVRADSRFTVTADPL